MIRTIPQRDLDVNDRIACQNAGLHSTLDTVVDSRMYSFGMAPPTMALTNS